MHKTCSSNRVVASINTNCSLSREGDAALFLQLYRPRKDSQLEKHDHGNERFGLQVGCLLAAGHVQPMPGHPLARCASSFSLSPLGASSTSLTGTVLLLTGAVLGKWEVQGPSAGCPGSSCCLPAVSFWLGSDVSNSKTDLSLMVTMNWFWSRICPSVN